MSFRVGQRVRCICASDLWCWEDLRTKWSGPTLDQIFTVDGVDRAGHPVTGEIIEWIGLAGVRRPGFEVAPMFEARHFRPVEDDEFERLEALCANPRGARIIEKIVD
jgi:hypothetical protein